MKLHPLPALVLLSLACSTALAVDLKSVPDLPPDVADQLTRVGDSTWLGNGRARSKARAVVAPVDKRDCWSQHYWTAQVTYPRTYCVAPDSLGTLLGDHESASLDARGASADGSVRVFRHAHAGSDGSYQLLACVTRSGPWLAQITKSETCAGSTSHVLAPFSHFQPQIPGAALAFPPIEWDGTPEGLPPLYGWASDPAPWSTPMAGGRCPGTISYCEGEEVEQIPGDEPGMPIF